ncbi:MAG: hypothetical protein AAFW95_07935, partial [Cyanobacteria bacterium J06638_6]
LEIIMKRLFASILLTAATAGVATLHAAQPSASLAQEIMPQQTTTSDGPDARVEAALDSLGLTYDVQTNGSIKVTMRFEGDRTQAVYISSATSTLGNMELRKVSSPANLTEGPIPTDVANTLLRENASKKLGAWQTVELQDQRLLTLFTAQINANSSPEELKAALGAVLITADEMEVELTGGDRF